MDLKTKSRLIFVCVVVAFATNFQLYNNDVVNNPHAILINFTRSSFNDHYGHDPPDTELNLLWSLTAAAPSIGAIFGSLTTKFVSEKLGRKHSLIMNSVICCVGAIIVGSSKPLGAFEVLIAGRVIMGFSMGLGFCLSGLFLTEIPPTALRGTCGTIQKVMLTVGDILAGLLSLPQILGTDSLWPFLLAFPLLPSILLIIVLPFVRDSPRHLFLTKDNRVQSKKSIDYYQGKSNSAAALMDLESEKTVFQEICKFKARDLLATYRYRRPFIVCVVLVCGMELSGIGPIFVYSSSMFENIGISPDNAKYVTMSLGVVNFILAIIITQVIETAGRRILLMVGLSIAFCSLLGVIVFSAISSYEHNWTKYLVVVSIFCYLIGFGIFGPLEWMIAAEMFDKRSRSTALSVLNVCLWTVVTINNFVYFPFKEKVGVAISFIPFAVFTFITMIVAYKFVPETKGRRIEEIVMQYEEKETT